MKDLFTQFSDGRLSPTERQIKAAEGIWKSLDLIERHLSIIASNMATDAISTDIANDMPEQINSAIDDFIANEISLVTPRLWSDEERSRVRKRFANKPRHYAIEQDKEMRMWMVYNWNCYCDKWWQWKAGDLGRKPRLADLMTDVGFQHAMTHSLRWYVEVTGILTIDQYEGKEKIEIK